MHLIQNRMRKITIIFLLVIVATKVSFAQTEKTPFDQSLKEKIIFFTDRNLYLVGERIWFSALLSHTDSASSPVSNLLYVELYNQEHTPVVKQKFRIDSCLTSSYLTIPENLISGNYHIRAYTKFMRNFPIEDFSYTNVQILNPRISLPETNTIRDKAVSFFPEGGAWVYGKINQISLRISKSLIDQIAQAEITDSEDQVLSQCQLESYGLASFQLTPNEGEKYFLRLKLKNGTTSYFDFPSFPKKEITILSQTQKKGINIQLFFDPNSNLDGQVYKIDVSNNQNKSSFSDHFVPTNHLYQTTILYDKLSNGLNFITIKNKQDQIKAVLIKYIAYPEAQAVRLNTNKNKYAPREAISLQVNTNSQLRWSNVTVVKKGTAILPTQIKEKHLYDVNKFNDFLMSHLVTNTETVQQINQILTIYGDLYFNNLSQEKNTKQQELQFLPEIRGVSISGVLVDKTSQKPIPNKAIFVSVFGDNNQLHAYRSSPEGRFYFSLENLLGIQDICLCADNSNSTNAEIKIDNDFEQRIAEQRSLPFYISEKKADLIKEMYINAQIDHYYQQKENIKHQANNYFLNDSLVFTSSILLADYVQMTSLKDVFREIIPLTNVIDNRKEQKIRLYNEETTNYLDNPLVLLNNIPIFDLVELFQTDANLIANVSVINHPFYLGDYLANGIVSIKTKQNNFANFDFSEKANFLKYSTLFPNLFPKHTHYSSNNEKQDRKPNFANCLYWNSQIERSKQARYTFYASDHCSEYTILFRAITKDGKMIEKQKIISIEKPN